MNLPPKLLLCLLPAFFLFSASGRLHAQTDAARELAQLQKQRDQALAVAAEPIQRRYAAALEPLLRRATAAGDLDTAVKIREELARLGVSSGVTAQTGTDEAKRNALRVSLRDSKWKMGDKSFALHADGTTSASWHDKKGKWKVTGPLEAELAITNSMTMKKATFDETLKVITFVDAGSAGEVARKIEK